MLLGASSALACAAAALARAPVVILPGFGNAAVDYIAPLGQPEDVGLRSALLRRGHETVDVVPLERIEWLRVATGLLEPAFWQSKAAPTGLAYNWYLERARLAIESAHEASGGERVMIVGHSAGGWLARAVLADGAWPDGRRASELVSTLVTLGTPHFPPPDGSDPTRGALTLVDEAYPGAYLAAEGIRYITVAGDAIVGSDAAATAVSDQAGQRKTASGASAAKVAFDSYRMVCGRGDVTGDGVVRAEPANLRRRCRPHRPPPPATGTTHLGAPRRRDPAHTARHVTLDQ